MSATHDDYVNMRILVDYAEHQHDDEALVHLRKYIEALEAVASARARARSKLPIPPFRIMDALPVLTAARGGIELYTLGSDWSPEAENLQKRREAVITLFRTINEIQWGTNINDVDADVLGRIAEALSNASDVIGAAP